MGQGLDNYFTKNSRCIVHRQRLSPGETKGGDDRGPVHQRGHQQHGHDHQAVALQGPGDQGVAAQPVQLRVPGLGPAHPGGGHLITIVHLTLDNNPGHLAAAVGQPVPVSPAPLRVSPVRMLCHTATPDLGLKKVHGGVAAGLLAVHLHAAVDSLLERLHHPLPEDEGDHDGDKLDQVEAAQTQGILKQEPS